MDVHKAASKNDAAALDLVRKYTPERIDEPDASGRTALHRAALGGQMLAIKTLLEVKAEINRRGKAGMTPLWMAAWSCRSDCVKLLIKSGADVNLPDNDNHTPYWAAIHPAVANDDERFIIQDMMLAAGGT